MWRSSSRPPPSLELRHCPELWSGRMVTCPSVGRGAFWSWSSRPHDWHCGTQHFAIATLSVLVFGSQSSWHLLCTHLPAHTTHTPIGCYGFLGDCQEARHESPSLGLYISLPLYTSEIWESPPSFNFFGGVLLVSKVLSLSLLIVSKKFPKKIVYPPEKFFWEVEIWGDLGLLTSYFCFSTYLTCPDTITSHLDAYQGERQENKMT